MKPKCLRVSPGGRRVAIQAAILKEPTGDSCSGLREGNALNAVRLTAGEAANETSMQSALSECVSRTVRRYLADIGDTEGGEGLHALVIREVEGPLLREVLAFHEGNQSRAAAALGINRATLRKKLVAHGIS